MRKKWISVQICHQHRINFLQQLLPKLNFLLYTFKLPNPLFGKGIVDNLNKSLILEDMQYNNDQ